jgi:hypothetical protein
MRVGNGSVLASDGTWQEGDESDPSKCFAEFVGIGIGILPAFCIDLSLAWRKFADCTHM